MPNILRFSATNDGWKHSVRKGFDWAKQHLALSLPLQQKVEPGCFLMDDPAPGPNCDSIHSKEEAVFSHLGFSGRSKHGFLLLEQLHRLRLTR